jgi:hypothetical protein
MVTILNILNVANIPYSLFFIKPHVYYWLIDSIIFIVIASNFTLNNNPKNIRVISL